MDAGHERDVDEGGVLTSSRSRFAVRTKEKAARLTARPFISSPELRIRELRPRVPGYSGLLCSTSWTVGFFLPPSP